VGHGLLNIMSKSIYSILDSLKFIAGFVVSVISIVFLLHIVFVSPHCSILGPKRKNPEPILGPQDFDSNGMPLPGIDLERSREMYPDLYPKIQPESSSEEPEEPEDPIGPGYSGYCKPKRSL
jgi:hypothetical protein